MSSYYEKILATGEVKCIDEEIPFEIPQGWEWCRLRNLCTIFGRIGFRGYTKSDMVEKGNGAISISPSNMKENGNMDFNVCSYISWYKYEESPEIQIQINDVLVVKTGSSYGKTCIIKSLPERATINPQIAVLKFIGVIPAWLTSALNSPHVQNQFNDYVIGTSIPTFSQEKLGSTLLPCPPMQEQQRISLLIKNLMYHISHYDESQKRLAELNLQVKDDIKKSLLQEAIQGKLVQQIAEEGTAQELLEQIKTEKQKLVKAGKLKKSSLNDSVIFRGDDNKYYTIDKKEKICIDDEMPFDIPDTWQWCRLGTLFSHCTGKALNASNLKGSLMTYITTSNLYWDRFELDNLKRMRFTDEEIEKCTATFGDLLVCEGGDIGRAAIWNYPYDIRIQNHIHKLRAYKQLCTKFFFWVFYFYKATGRIGGKGIGIQGLSSKALDKILIPLPPLKEQQRIVAQIEKLFEQLH